MRNSRAARDDTQESRGLAHGVIGPALVIAFGVSSVAPAGSVVGGLFILVPYAGFASPLVVPQATALAASPDRETASVSSVSPR